MGVEYDARTNTISLSLAVIAKASEHNTVIKLPRCFPVERNPGYSGLQRSLGMPLSGPCLHCEGQRGGDRGISALEAQRQHG